MEFHPEARNMIIWRFGHLSLVKDPPSGYWLSPRRNFIWGFSYPSWWKILLRAIGFHPEANNSPYGLRQSIFMQDPPSGYWTSPRSKARLYVEMIILWSYGILFGLRYWLAFGYWCTWHGCTEASIPLRQAKRGVIGALQVNATWRNEPRAREAERPAAPFGLSS